MQSSDGGSTVARYSNTNDGVHSLAAGPNVPFHRNMKICRQVICLVSFVILFGKTGFAYSSPPVIAESHRCVESDSIDGDDSTADVGTGTQSKKSKAHKSKKDVKPWHVDIKKEQPDYYARDKAYSSKDDVNLSIKTLPDRDRSIINVHEHVLNMQEAERLLIVMDELGIEHVCLMGTSKYTFTLDNQHGFEEYGENNEEIIRIVKKYPTRFSAFVTLNPVDDGNLERLRDYIKRGASGLKLYLGHGGATGKEPFHVMGISDPRMTPVFEYCNRQRIPVTLHVNLIKYYDEFVKMMDRNPNLVVCVPHFGLQKNNMKRLNRLAGLFDRYPNMFSDISFGWWEFHIQGFQKLARWPSRFNEYLTKYSDRFMYSSDMVLEKSKDVDYIRNTLRSYIQLLEMKRFRFFYKPLMPMRGVGLGETALKKIYNTTPRKFLGESVVGRLKSSAKD